jgi:hypothetical protein
VGSSAAPTSDCGRVDREKLNSAWHGKNGGADLARVDLPGSGCEGGPGKTRRSDTAFVRCTRSAALPGESQALISDDTVLERDPGYEKDAQQRGEDCRRVRSLLMDGGAGVHANLRSIYGETLVHLALEYDHRCVWSLDAHFQAHVPRKSHPGAATADHTMTTTTTSHRHPPEMLVVVLESGADANAPNAMDGERPLDSPWLEHIEDGHVSEKRTCLQRFGARAASNSVRALKGWRKDSGTARF